MLDFQFDIVLPWDAWAWSLLSFVSVAPALYTLGACVCRLRYGRGVDLATNWVLMYLAVALVAGLILMSLVYGEAQTAGIIIIWTLASYINITAPSWANGVPLIARVKHETDNSKNAFAGR